MENSRYASYRSAVKDDASAVFRIVPLHEPIKMEHAVADILLVPSLTGDAVNTWSHGNVCWPRDLLPQALSSPVRILSFGYENGRHSNVYPDIDDIVLHLISELERVRPVAEKSRPLIAVAYSLGGIVFKKVLILCNNKPSLRHILAALSGVVFLAAPHQGNTLANVAIRLIKQLRLRLPRKFINALKQKSIELGNVASDFQNIANQRNLPIFSFYELLAVRGRLGCFDDVVVSKDSALLRIPSEDALGVYANHREICRYKDADNPIFCDVTSRLQRLVDLGPLCSNSRVFLPFDVTPHFIGRQDYLQQIHKTFTGSNDRQIVALYGDGGTGKTEIALKYARESANRYDYIFFVDSTNIQSLESGFTRLHSKLELPPSNNCAVNDIKQFLRLERFWLMILDNDKDWLALNWFGFPETTHGHIIITSRLREHTSDSRVAKALSTNALEPVDATEFLLSRAGVDIKERHNWGPKAGDVIKHIGCQPLAVDSAAAYMLCYGVTIDEYLHVLKGRKVSRRLLSYRPKASIYQTSVETIIQSALDEVKKSPDAFRLLNILVWLDRNKTTISFLKRAVSPQRRWGSNGQIETIEPQRSYVPLDLVRLINGPGFCLALRELQSYSLIARSGKLEDGRNLGNEDAMVLHPLTYFYIREALPPNRMVENAINALSLVAHAYPIVQAGLDQSPKRTVLEQVYQFSRNCEYLAEENLDLTMAIQKVDSREGQEKTFTQITAEMFLEAARGYGEGSDHLDFTLLKWAKILIKSSERTGLQARLWSTRLPLEFYSKGKFTDGCEAAATFLQNTSFGPGGRITNNDNAQVGFLRHLSVEYLARDKSLSDKEEWERRVKYMDAWKPLEPYNPSELERYAQGMGIRMRGKLAKDLGQFNEAYFSLKVFIEQYAKHGSREEGWAIGDFGQAVLELEATNEDCDALTDLRTNGIKCGHDHSISEPDAKPCEIISQIYSQAIENRMVTREHSHQNNLDNIGDSDTMFLEINHAVSILREGTFRPERYAEAEQKLLGLKDRFENMLAMGALWHDDQTRHFSVLAYLAQISHLQMNWEAAQSRWIETINYGEFTVKEWKNTHYYIEVARYSLANAQLQAGGEPDVIITKLDETIRRVNAEKVTWNLGLGTFWLEYIRKSMAQIMAVEETAREV
ncbi:LipA and NB-ARC domain-containing protein [Nannizzia gypsea CBS 118893]|uniref:LipA and NB-ARC domain-containing protein n=1 Tax=Arthroderma gypseum (strain ATCC MYA-4604 / CBS 118893) TaxID=535722 RepID=E5R1C2_ARTGP|nr:LipA and NB-ARC domain-containing protein [Nannizzia gypsea CBS 118893]EFQ97673.1 LipA and NB-ARC domain-containing protein [Nannizzia gypsea CBS 118893]